MCIAQIFASLYFIKVSLIFTSRIVRDRYFTCVIVSVRFSFLWIYYNKKVILVYFVCKPLTIHQSIRVNIYWDSSQKVWPLNQSKCSLLKESQPQGRKKSHCLQEIGCLWIVRLVKHCSQKGGQQSFLPCRVSGLFFVLVHTKAHAAHWNQRGKEGKWSGSRREVIQRCSPNPSSNHFVLCP